MVSEDIWAEAIAELHCLPAALRAKAGDTVMLSDNWTHSNFGGVAGVGYVTKVDCESECGLRLFINGPTATGSRVLWAKDAHVMEIVVS